MSDYIKNIDIVKKHYVVLSDNSYFNKDQCSFSRKKIKRGVIVKISYDNENNISLSNITKVIKFIQYSFKKYILSKKCKSLLKSLLKNDILKIKYDNSTLSDEELQIFLKYKDFKYPRCNRNQYYKNLKIKNTKINKKKIKEEKKKKQKESHLKFEEKQHKEKEEANERFKNKGKKHFKKRCYTKNPRGYEGLPKSSKPPPKPPPTPRKISPIYKYYDILEIPYDIKDEKKIRRFYIDKIRSGHADKTKKSASDGSEINNARDKIYEYFGWPK